MMEALPILNLKTQCSPNKQEGGSVSLLSRALCAALEAFLWRKVAWALGLLIFAAAPVQGQSSYYASRQVGGGHAASRAGNYVPLSEAEGIPLDLSTVITVRLEEVTLEEALRRIAEEADVELVYGSEKVAVKKRVSLNTERITAREAFQEVLRGTGLRLMRLASGQLVVVDGTETEAEKEGRSEQIQKVKALVPVRLGQDARQAGTIAGTVTDSTSGEPLPGVNVVVEGTQQGASTDAQGQYTLSGVAAGTYTLQASFVGYAAQSVAGVEVTDGETAEVNFALQQSTVALEEVVAIGYGTQQRRDLTGSVSQVSTEELADLPVTRVDDALQGRVSGVQVVQNSGAPGSEPTIRIRGTSSINAGSDPLFVIDGFPGVGDLSSINPSNVASIQVLKDASATAIYGARGAGGVVLITTKQGAAGAPRVNFNVSYSLENVANRLDLLSAEQFALLANEANANAGQPPEFETPASLAAGTDWQDQVFKTGARREYQLSVAGGSEDVQYLLSGNYLDQEGILVNSFFNRGQARFNLDANLSDRLRVGNNVTASRTNANQFGGRSVRNALLFRPTLSVRGEDGGYTQMQVAQLNLENPIAGLEEPRNDNPAYTGLGNAFAEYTILDGLKVRTSLGGEFRYIEDKEYIPTTLQAGRLSGGSATVLTQKEAEWLSENTINYDRSFAGRHDVKLLAGYTLQRENIEFVQAGASQFANEGLGYNALSVGSVRAEPQTGVSESTLQSFLFRANYQLDDKYLFTATGRYDGSSKFGKGNEYGFFPSGAIGWRLSEERFFEGADFLTDLKLRASYGITGNQDIGTYAALASLSPVTTVFGDESRVGVQPTSVANPDLKWEETSQLDVGIDAALFDGQLSVTADYYLKRTSDLLLAVQLPSQTGFNNTIRNIGGVRNEGVELFVDLNTSLGPVSWNSSVNVSRNLNEVTDLGANKEIFPGVDVGGISSVNDQSIIIREGEPLGSFYGFVYEGLFQSQEEIQNSAQPNAEVGTPRYQDANGDGVIDDADKQIIGNGLADAYASFSNTFAYRGFQLQIRLNGSFGADILNTSRLELESLSGAFNNLTTVLDRWTPENTDTDIPKANAAGYPYIVTSRFIEDGTYLRVQNVSLSYEIPQAWSGGLRRASVYVTGTNLYTFTGYSGYDPEINLQGGSNVAYSIDYNPYPRARAFTLGVRLGL